MKINKLLLLLILFLQAFTVCGAIGFTNDNTVPTYHYYTQDHLGNNRAVVNDNGTVEQITHYYPFGGTYADVGLNSSLQPYKYNGKELDRMHGLNLYDYGARHYDAIVPMFTQIDPLAEKNYNFSPYVYCGNNPINCFDLSGKDWIHASYEDEQFVYYDERIHSQDDIDKFYNNSKTIKYLGTTGSVYQGTENGDQLSYCLNSDGSYSDAYGNLLSKEVSIGNKLHIGSSAVQKNLQPEPNMYGVYLGPNNPHSQGIDLYAIPPIDKLDYAAFRHDKGYDSKGVSGISGVFLNSSNYGDDWNLAVRSLNELITTDVTSSRWRWALATSSLFGSLAITKRIIELLK